MSGLRIFGAWILLVGGTLLLGAAHPAASGRDDSPPDSLTLRVTYSEWASGYTSTRFDSTRVVRVGRGSAIDLPISEQWRSMITVAIPGRPQHDPNRLLAVEEILGPDSCRVLHHPSLRSFLESSDRVTVGVTSRLLHYTGSHAGVSVRLQVLGPEPLKAESPCVATRSSRTHDNRLFENARGRQLRSEAVVLGRVTGLRHHFVNPLEQEDSTRSQISILSEEVWKGSFSPGDTVRAITAAGLFHGGRWMSRGTPIQVGARILAWLERSRAGALELSVRGHGLFSDSLLFTPEARGVALHGYRKRLLEWERRERQPYSALVVGTVLRKESRSPHRHAAVRVLGTADSARTDRNGAYQLFVSRFGRQQLRVNLADGTFHDFEAVITDEAIDSLEIAVDSDCR